MMAGRMLKVAAMAALVVMAASSLAGCGLDSLSGNGDASRQAFEHQQSIVATPVAAVVEPVVVAAPPACYPVFRILACGPNGEEIWL